MIPPADIPSAVEDLARFVSYEHGGLLLRDEDGAATLAGQGETALCALRDHVYSRYFCRWSPPREKRRSRWADRSSGEPQFVATLSAACRGAMYWEPGWRVLKAEQSWAFVSNGHICLFVDDRRQIYPAEASVGAEVHLRLPCARESLAPGFFYLVGRAGPIAHHEHHLKLYLNVGPDAVAGLLELLLGREGAGGVRFEAKFVNDPAAYHRVDTGTLYVEPKSYPSLLALLTQTQAEHPGWFRPGTPLFTQEVGPGIAVAEASRGPSAESFGKHRSRLMADGVLAALEAGEPHGPAWLRRISDAFARERLSAERPHLAESEDRPLQLGLAGR